MRNPSTIFTTALFIITALLPASAKAQDLTFFSGGLRAEHEHSSSYAWQVSYQQPLWKMFDWSFSWVNEGHAPDHHRDGQVFQLWARADLSDRFSLMAGAGPYRYFDTESARRGKSYKDTHGWGQIYSAGALWRFSPRWLAQARFNHIHAQDKEKTDSIQLGIGCALDPASPSDKEENYSDKQQEITVFYGKTVLNSLNSQNSYAYSVEFRQSPFRYMDWTLGWLNEGDPEQIRRNGVTLQIWPKRDFFNGRLSLGVGFGGYLVFSRNYKTKNVSDNVDLAGLVTMTASFRITPSWAVRGSWMRTVTDFNRDTDIMIGGLGYRF